MPKMEIIKYSQTPDGSDIIIALGCYFKNYFYDDGGSLDFPHYKHYVKLEITNEETSEKNQKNQKD